MSQAGKINDTVSPGSGAVLFLEGNTGGAVPPDGSGLIHVIGDGDTTVTGSPGTNTLTIDVTTYKQTTYTSADTWTPDPNMKYAKIYIWSGGSGGGSGRCGASGSAGGGGGGAAGGFSSFDVLHSNLQSASYSVTIGAGGNGGLSINAINTDGNVGNVGGLSSVGVIVGPNASTAGGTGGTTSTPGLGGNGFASLVSGTSFSRTTGQIVNSLTLGVGSGGYGGPNVTGLPGLSFNFASGTGGGSGSNYTSTSPLTGGAGGSVLAGDNSTVLIAGGTGGANTGANGGNGNPAIAFELLIGGTGGGGGGMNGTVTAGSGGNGGIPSGGGGGGAGNLNSNPSGAGGNGARGQIIICEFF